jgi:tetratricopeptide (TPR) repeat protein
MTRVWGWALVLGLVGCVVGCDAVPLTAPLWSEGERREESGRYLNEGLRAIEEGDQERADRLLQLAVTLQGSEGEGIVAVAQKLQEKGLTDKAAMLLKNALEEPPFHHDPYILGALARMYQTLDYQKEAQESQKRAEELVRDVQNRSTASFPEDPPTRLEMIQELLSAGRYCEEFGKDPEKAVTLLRAAVAMEPGYPRQRTFLDLRALSTLGTLLARHPTLAEDRNESVRLTRTAAQEAPHGAAYLHAYGFALLQKGDLSGARRVLREAANLDTDNAEVHFHLGQTYARQGLYSQAAIELDRALVLRPQHTGAAAARKTLPKPLPALASDLEEE